MPPGELWWLLEAKTPPEVRAREDTFAAIKEMMDAEREREAVDG